MQTWYKHALVKCITSASVVRFCPYTINDSLFRFVYFHHLLLVVFAVVRPLNSLLTGRRSIFKVFASE